MNKRALPQKWGLSHAHLDRYGKIALVKKKTYPCGVFLAVTPRGWIRLSRRHIMDILPQNGDSFKLCAKCKQYYPSTSEFFSRDKNRSDGLFPHCKQCRSKQRRKNIPIPVDPGFKRCSKCKDVFPETIEYFESTKTIKSGLHSQCKACVSKRRSIYHVNNRERHAAYSKEYVAKNKEKVTARVKRYVLANPEKRRAIVSRYRQTERGKIAARVSWHNRRSHKKNATGKHTTEELYQQLQNQKNKCYYCHKELSKERKGWTADHVIPLSRGGSNDISNIVIACPPCNFKKHTSLPHEWISQNKGGVQ